MSNTTKTIVGIGILGTIAYFLYNTFQGNKNTLTASDTTPFKDIARAKGFTGKQFQERQIGEAVAQKQFQMVNKVPQNNPAAGLSVVAPDLAKMVQEADKKYTATPAGRTKIVSPFTGQIDTVRNVFRQSPSISSLPAPKITAPAGTQLSATSLTSDRQFGAGLVTQRAKQAASAAKSITSSQKVSISKGRK